MHFVDLSLKKPVITHISFTHSIAIGNSKLDYSKYILFGRFFLNAKVSLFVQGCFRDTEDPGLQ